MRSNPRLLPPISARNACKFTGLRRHKARTCGGDVGNGSAFVDWRLLRASAKLVVYAAAEARRPAGRSADPARTVNGECTVEIASERGGVGRQIEDLAVMNRLFTAWVLEIQPRGTRGTRDSRRVVRPHLSPLRAGSAEPVRADIPSTRKITKPCSACGWCFSLRWYRSWTPSERRQEPGHTAPAGGLSPAASTMPNAVLTASTSTSSIPSNTSESHNGVAVCMTRTSPPQWPVLDRLDGERPGVGPSFG